MTADCLRSFFFLDGCFLRLENFVTDLIQVFEWFPVSTNAFHVFHLQGIVLYAVVLYDFCVCEFADVLAVVFSDLYFADFYHAVFSCSVTVDGCVELTFPGSREQAVVKGLCNVHGGSVFVHGVCWFFCIACVAFFSGM